MNHAKLERILDSLDARQRKVYTALCNFEEPTCAHTVVRRLPGNWKANSVQRTLHELSERGVARLVDGNGDTKGHPAFSAIVPQVEQPQVEQPEPEPAEDYNVDVLLTRAQASLKSLQETLGYLGIALEEERALTADQGHRLVALDNLLKELGK